MAARSLNTEIANLLINKGAVLDGHIHFYKRLNKDKLKVKQIQMLGLARKGKVEISFARCEAKSRKSSEQHCFSITRTKVGQ
jgi:hypothetical protein